MQSSILHFQRFGARPRFPFTFAWGLLCALWVIVPASAAAPLFAQAPPEEGRGEAGEAKPKDAADADEKAELPKPLRVGPGELQWWSLEIGRMRAAESRKPMVLAVPGSESEKFWKQLDDRVLSYKSTRKKIKDFVLVTGSGDADDIRALVGALKGDPLVAFVDFRGTVYDRFKGTVPERSRFTKGIKKIVSRNEALKQKFATVEAELKKARYGLEIKKYRPAVEALLKAKAVSLPPSSPPLAEIAALTKEFEAAFADKEKEAEEHDENERGVQAIKVYEELVKEFPFPDHVKKWRRKISELWRKVYGPGQ